MWRAAIAACCGAALALCLSPARAQIASPNGPDAASELSVASDAEVRFRGKTLFVVTEPIGALSVQSRAAEISRRIEQVAQLPDRILGELRVLDREGRSDLYAGEVLVRSITDRDAGGTGRTRRQLAADQIEILRAALADEFRARTTTHLLRSTGLAIAASIALLAGLALVRRGYRAAADRTMRVASRWPWPRRMARLRLVTPQGVATAARATVAVLAWIVALALVYLYLEYTLSMFPWTRGAADQMVRYVGTAAGRVVAGLVDYLPNLVNILLIVLVARLLLRVIRALFVQIGGGQIFLPGFYPEWATTTNSLVRFFVIAIAAVMIFPYLPGSGSEGFRGISVFVGLLISLGAASAIANVIAGVVITYMRPFQPGDRVRIADAEGDVLSKDLFVVRVRTIKNVDITIPNSLVLANHIVNFSSAAASHGLVLHTRVTIGYDVPWQNVHELLLAAAGRVEGLAADPAPFVLQKSLDDFSVCYELNVATRHASDMAMQYSRLHAAIQSEFHGAGVEIMSPHYVAARDGNRAAIPDEYLPSDYRTPGFIFGRFGARPGREHGAGS